MDPAALAARVGARHRVDEREADRAAFERLRERVERGFEWGVGALATDGVGRLLLVREDGRWLLPGGEVEPGETRRAALAREVREETGLDVSVGDLLAVTEQRVVHGDERVEFRFAVYRAEPTTPADATPAEAGVEAVEWVDELPTDTLDREFVARLWRG